MKHLHWQRLVFCFLVVLLQALMVPSASAELPFDLHGFWEAGAGVRTEDDPNQDDISLLETRLQVDISKDTDSFGMKLRADFLYDYLPESLVMDIEEGKGWIDLREANVIFYPWDSADVKMGRQILTWGTGDLIFINDLFPKDWNSFFIGRDKEYLKAPSDACKFSFFNDTANFDLVYVPRFDSDRFIDGTRISYWNSSLGEIAGRNALVKTEKPEEWFEDDEWALRIYKTIQGYELALYGYTGFWKSPSGMDLSTGEADFNELSVYGGSVRGNFLKGVGNIEVGYYDSAEDRSGDDPFIRNSEMRFLAGYEQEVIKDLTVGLQYYLEHMLEYADYLVTLLPGIPARSEDRHVFTLRLTKTALNQNLTLSLFTFYSPTDEDAYLRPKIRYKFDDFWTGEIGANFFTGKEDHTFFGQFQKNTNIYVTMRYGF